MHRLKKIIKPFEGLIKKTVKDQKNNKLKQGCYLYELEADSTIPSEYILLMHFLGEINVKLEIKIQKYILSKQNKDGGWPLFFEGESDISASVKAYYALKLSGLGDEIFFFGPEDFDLSFRLKKIKKTLLNKSV